MIYYLYSIIAIFLYLLSAGIIVFLLYFIIKAVQKKPTHKNTKNKETDYKNDK